MYHFSCCWKNPSLITNIFSTFLLLILPLVVVNGQGIKVENIALSANSPVSCDTIIASSRFSGTCCSLNNTAGGGCVLNVINGRCTVQGQYWSLDFTSTLSSGGASCPPSEYNVLGGGEGDGGGGTSLEIGQRLCVEGFVMDFFCINRGTLLDNPSVVTLENPELHSVHCLVDVASCRNSAYEILLAPETEVGIYRRGFRLSETAKNLAVALAREVGTCFTCNGDGPVLQGFRAAFDATVVDLGDASTPPLIDATDLVHSTFLDDPCAEFSNNNDGPTPSPESTMVDLVGRCGDCWCIPGNNGRDDCPTSVQETTGIVDSFDLSRSILWSTFILTNANDVSFLTLDEGCYPFRDAIGDVPINGYPESAGPQCTRPMNGVCAYLFTPVETCSGRPYEIATYESREAAEQAGAVVTHEGGCGVCSSAQDFWARIQNYETFEVSSVICSSSYIFSSQSTRFETLIDCFVGLGFTRPCATLWAHSAATSAFQCSGVCFPSPITGVPDFNEAPPACAITPCVACSNVWQGDFDALAGRTLHKSGITERLARPCDDFARIVHDPCTMAVADETPSSSPTNFMGPPRNDRCVNATRLEENIEITGDTTTANFDYLSSAVCGPASDRPGVWYEIVGSGQTVTIKLCSNNDSEVVFGIFSQCNTIECVGFAPDAALGNSCSNRETSISYTLDTAVGESYYVHVRGNGNVAGGANFNLIYTSVDGGNNPGPSFVPATPSPTGPTPAGPPANDRCIQSIRLEVGEEVSGDTSNANFDYNSQGVCGALSDRRAVWYTIIGAGGDVTVSLCTDNGRFTTFGVFAECNSQMCVGFPEGVDNFPAICAAGQSVSYSFTTIAGESYYIHVRGDWKNGIGSRFRLFYEESIFPSAPPTISTPEPSESPSLVPSVSPSSRPSGTPSIEPINESESPSFESSDADSDGALAMSCWNSLFSCSIFFATCCSLGW